MMIQHDSVLLVRSELEIDVKDVYVAIAGIAYVSFGCGKR